MTTAQGIRAGRAYVELFANDSKLVRGLQSAERRLQAFGASVRAIGVKMFAAGSLIATPLTVSIKAASDAEEGMNKFGAVFGKESKAAGEFVEKLAADVGRSAVDIRDSISSFQAMFLGLDFDPSQARQMSQSLQALVLDFGSFFNVSDQEAGDRFLAALSGSSEVFDKFGINTKAAALDQKLLEMGINKSTANATEQEKVMARVAIIMESMGKQGATGDAVKTAGSFANQMKRLQSTLKDAAVAIGSALIPVITPLVTALSAGVQFAAAWIKENSGLVVSIAKIAAIVVGAGVALLALGAAASVMGAAMGVGVTVLTTIGAVLSALLSPIGLVVAGITGLATWILTSTDVGSRALSWLGSTFEELKNTALAAWKGIGDALAAGDIGLAAKILWLTLKMEWKKGVNALNQIWVKVKEFFLSTWTEAVFGAATIATNAWAGLQTGWTETVDFLRDTWTTFTTFLAKNWNKVVGFIKGAWQKLKSTVTGKDTTAVQKQIEADTARANAELGAKRDQEIASREQARKTRLSEIESERTGTLSELEDRREAEHVARQKSFASDLEGTEAALDEAKKEWQAAIEEAAKAKESSGGEADGAPGSKSPLPGLQEKLQGAGTAITNARRSLAAVDASSSEGLAMFAAASRGARTSAEDQTAKNTEKLVEQQKQTNTTLDRIERKTQTPKVAKLTG